MLLGKDFFLVRGRLQQAQLELQPIVIPDNHKFTELIKEDSEEKILHDNSDTLLQTCEKF